MPRLIKSDGTIIDTPVWKPGVRLVQKPAEPPKAKPKPKPRRKK